MTSSTARAKGPNITAAFSEVASETVALGRRLRSQRIEKGLGVREFARRIGVSPSLISHIERGKGAPSVKTLYAAVAALDIPMSSLFTGPNKLEIQAGRKAEVSASLNGRSGLGPVQRGASRQSIQLEHGFRWENLIAGSATDVEFIEVVIEVGGGQRDTEMKTHNGSEYGVVLKGKLGIALGFKTYVLEPGDSISFESTLPHCMWNAGHEPLHAIWFVRGRTG